MKKYKAVVKGLDEILEKSIHDHGEEKGEEGQINDLTSTLLALMRPRGREFEFEFNRRNVKAIMLTMANNLQKELHVLAVDDNATDRMLVEKLLISSSCKVTTTENGLRALEYLGVAGASSSNGQQNGSKVNLIITDHCMHGMSGYELLKKIKKSAALKDIPVVVVSSENIPSVINKCLEEGAKMFMLKPLKHVEVQRLTCQLMQCKS